MNDSMSEFRREGGRAVHTNEGEGIAIGQWRFENWGC